MVGDFTVEVSSCPEGASGAAPKKQSVGDKVEWLQVCRDKADDIVESDSEADCDETDQD